MEMARAMLVDQALPNTFWAEAVATSVYIQNILPSKSLEEDVTPLEIWSGRKQRVEHLRVFGCLCYVQVPIEKRRKLDDKSKRGVFIGYSSESKGYRILLLDEEKIEVSRDVIFDEEKSWDWEKKEVKKNFILPIETESSRNQQDQGVDANIDTQVEDGEGGDQSEEESPLGPRGFRLINELMQRSDDENEMALTHEMCLIMTEEPQFFDEAVNEKAWREAMEEEIRMIEKNGTWQMVKKPKDKNIISVKWIYRLKTNANGEPIKHKARLVARGFTQEYGVDYLETFAPVSRHDTIRTLLAVAAQKKWKLFQMDVKSAFLNGELQEDIYVEQPPGFIREGEEGKVLRLHKALYGLKQAPRAWYGRIDGYFVKHGFKRSINDAVLYVKKTLKEILVVSLYVDDIIITGSNLNLINKFKDDMKREFEMTDLGELSYFLGMEIIQDEDGMFLSQKKYARRLLEKFGMNECKSLSTPLTTHGKSEKGDYEEFKDVTKYRSIVGGLLYLCASRPDLMYASSYLSRYMAKPLKRHYQEAKRVLRYVKGTTEYGVQFKSTQEPELVGYSDSDWGGSVEDKKSTSGYVFTLGSAVFCWNSNKQKTVAQSTAEAEYIAVCAATNQAIWLQRLVNEVGFKTEKGVKIYCDNKSAIAIGKNPVQHKRTKHIDIKYHFVREAEQKGLIKLEHCPGESQVADIQTKPLTTSRFEDLKMKLGVHTKLN
ncbi:Retrovirus-related Pol polyprotein from transposon TNT 1-94 [Cardamine amara subsp. amara]|uniref:Retrovirus-related Pol polyprotein from transposon TNT 1-94 n=1 Tax=Cardamine amara subsp. amara TaxID=228776 RepID=A0ABD1B4K3_CARAN